MKPLRTPLESSIGPRLAETFNASRDTLEVRLENFPKYARRKTITRFLALYELFKLALPVKGSVVECGVFRGFGLMTWAHLSAVLEPANLTRRIYGFDTFAGFPETRPQDHSSHYAPSVGELASDSRQELEELIRIYDDDRFLGHVGKVNLVQGSLEDTLPPFLDANPHLVVSLLFLDMDLFGPTSCALKHFLPRMPKGAILAFDELDNPRWPGETLAAMEGIGLGSLALKRFEWDPYIAYAVL